uniref:Thioredoxin n=1 Tax=Candidatus Kentrum sp. FM TaxID=2126340 RepID=A0A450SC12_9GAMM|nr:MAG: putative thioredoxin [Candidatus Kentron sp. FM]VFJ71893.1 MAG: putative thioredoxin [Candidatus Kentron sp. FM]VFK18521.1 MAG: putative thioredoxin [Candidatus Kentron sp. FM]
MSTSKYVFDVDERNFPEIVLENSRRMPVLVDFWAAWCAPCRMLAPVLEKLAEEFGGTFLVAKVDTDEQRQLAAEYSVQSLPTVKVFRNAAVVEEFLGAQPEGVIRQVLDRHVERESDRMRTHAMALHEQAKTEEGIRHLRDALAMDPANERIFPDLARLLLAQGHFTEVEALLQGLPVNRQPDADIKEIRIQLEFARIAGNAPPVTELEDRVAKAPGDCEAHYQLGARKVMTGDYETAMNHFLEIMRRDRRFREDAGRKALVDTFALIGEGDPSLVSRYRSLMSSMLY